MLFRLADLERGLTFKLAYAATVDLKIHGLFQFNFEFLPHFLSS